MLPIPILSPFLPPLLSLVFWVGSQGPNSCPSAAPLVAQRCGGFHLSRLMGSLDVVLKPNSNRIVLLLGKCNRFDLTAAHLVFDQVCNRATLDDVMRVYVAQGQMCYTFCFFINGSVIKGNPSLLTSQMI